MKSIPIIALPFVTEPRRGKMIIEKNKLERINPEGVTEIKPKANHTTQTNIFRHILPQIFPEIRYTLL